MLFLFIDKTTANCPFKTFHVHIKIPLHLHLHFVKMFFNFFSYNRIIFLNPLLFCPTIFSLIRIMFFLICPLVNFFHLSTHKFHDSLKYYHLLYPLLRYISLSQAFCFHLHNLFHYQSSILCLIVLRVFYSSSLYGFVHEFL